LAKFNVDNEKILYMKKEKLTKFHKYDSNYESIGFSSNGSEEQKPLCVICFEVSKKAMNPSKLKKTS